MRVTALGEPEPSKSKIPKTKRALRERVQEEESLKRGRVP
jgi:hypothetical protein